MIKIKVKHREYTRWDQYQDNKGKIWKVGDKFENGIIRYILRLDSKDLDILRSDAKEMRNCYPNKLDSIIVLYKDDGWDFLNLDDEYDQN
jgi:hypothetical protein